MRLKKIILHGFKSFANKTVIDFPDQYSVIVGPNGSGKSNISDAIRWVLGEQSPKSLRGDKMQDVVFAGTNSHKAMNYCKVSIVFDNQDRKLNIDQDELVISRTAYRDGENVYSINKNRVRLKDVKELLLDTGLGKEGYSIISQGRIDEILNARADQRRELIDEACGVSKYKYKRDESNKKLANTLENLDRLEDILAQIAVNRNYLKSEAEKAKRALAIQDELEINELSYFSNYRDDLAIKIESLDREIREKELLVKDKEKIISQLKTKQEDNKTKISNTDNELNKLENKSDFLKDRYSQLNTDIKINEEKAKNLKEVLARNKEEISIAQSKLGSLDKKLGSTKLSLKELKESYSDTKKRLDTSEKLKNELDEEILEISKIFDEKNEELSKNKSDLSQKELLLNTNRNLSDNYIREIKEIEKVLSGLEGKDKSLKEKLQENLKKEKDLSTSIINKKEQITLEENNRSQLAEKLTGIEKDINLAKSELRDLESSLNFHKNIYKNYEGFNRGVQNFLKLAEKNPKLRSKFINTLADEIKVKRGFEKAIDYSLSGKLQHIITLTSEDARDLINYLKRNKLGRLTFMPLDRYKTRPRDIGSLERGDYICFADEVINTRKELKTLIYSLLSRTIIVKDVDTAVQISRKSKNRIVTLDGDIVNYYGSMVGGSNTRRNSSLINRKEDIISLKKKISDKSNEIKVLLEASYQYKTKEEERISSIQKLEKELVLLKEKYEDLAKKKSDINLEIKITEARIETSRSSIEDKKIKLESFTSASQDDRKIQIKNIENLENDLKALKKQIDSIKLKLEDAGRISFKHTNRLEILERDTKLEENTLNSLKLEIREEKNKLNRLNKEKDLKEKEEINLNSHTNINSSDLEEIDNELMEVKAKIIKAKSSLIELKKSQDEMEEKSININEFISQNKLSLSKLSIKKDNLQEKLTNKFEQLLENYAESKEELDKKLDSINKVSTSKGKISSLRIELTSIGSFNIDSISAFEKVDKDYNFYLKQKKDLLDAKEDVENIIKDLEELIREDFEVSFKEINARFKRIFTRLFEGGKAKLVLTNQDRLISGVDIEVKLPGKIKQNLSLLSGGERSLIAVCLLFAIFETKPAPFCILDEADAALDEANISRYMTYLKSFEDIQFIIITHRKTSMELANILYGVTMEEEGISKIIKLEFDDYKKEA